MSEQVIGVDLGGTAIKLGRYTHTGECIASLKIATPQPSTPEPVIRAIASSYYQRPQKFLYSETRSKCDSYSRSTSLSSKVSN